MENAANEKNTNGNVMDAMNFSKHGTKISKFRVVMDMRDNMVISAPPFLELIDHGNLIKLMDGTLRESDCSVNPSTKNNRKSYVYDKQGTSNPDGFGYLRNDN